MPTARPQPIKHLAFERGCTQTQFAAANALHRMKVFRVFNASSRRHLSSSRKRARTSARRSESCSVQASCGNPSTSRTRFRGATRAKRRQGDEQEAEGAAHRHRQGRHDPRRPRAGAEGAQGSAPMNKAQRRKQKHLKAAAAARTLAAQRKRRDDARRTAMQR